MKTKPADREKRNRFVETARELGLDNEEAAAAFERAFGKIAPPKKKGDIAPPKADNEEPSHVRDVRQRR